MNGRSINYVFQYGPGILDGHPRGGRYINCMPDVLARSRCPYCGLQHSWWKQDARYVDSIPQSQWVENASGSRAGGW
jgi:hypothetical protein